MDENEFKKIYMELFYPNRKPEEINPKGAYNYDELKALAELMERRSRLSLLGEVKEVIEAAPDEYRDIETDAEAGLVGDYTEYLISKLSAMEKGI